MTVTPARVTEAEQDRIAGWLAPEEFRVLEMVCETLLPSLAPPPGSSEALAAYYQRSARDMHVAMLMAEALAPEDAQVQAEFRQLLALLASPVSGLLLVGKPKSFLDLSLEQREKYLLAMARSPVAQLRKGFQAMKRLAGFIFFAAPDQYGVNPNWKIFDYSVPAVSPASGERPIQPLAISEDTTLECDAVVIGSGAGGGVVAGELAMAGKDVVILEKGGYYAESDFTLQEAQAMPELYLKRGTMATKDLNTLILAGSALGGGTLVNWTTSFRAPADVLEEWSRLSGLRLFTEDALQASYTAVEQRIQVNTENSAHNRQNQLLFEGAQRLGYHAGNLRRNAVGCEQRCGTCGFGCRYGCKQSTTKTYLQDAFDRGALILVHCSADRVLIENGRVVGVEATAYDPATAQRYKIAVRAKAVVVSAGSIHSPAVLLRSDVGNKHIGQHLHLHPTTVISAVYPEQVYPWTGVMQSAYSQEFSRLDGLYGYVLEVPPTHPGLMGLATPWHGSGEYRRRMADIAYVANIIVLARDKGEGTITLNRDGEPVVDYVTRVYDRRHLLHGLRTAARVHFAAGAREVTSLHSKRTHATRGSDGTISERALRAFDAQLERHGMGPNYVTMFSAHQMGTCRMGIDAVRSVVDEHGEVHGVKGLFVSDGSVFPAASGVNPMLTIMALSHYISQYVKTVV